MKNKNSGVYKKKIKIMVCRDSYENDIKCAHCPHYNVSEESLTILLLYIEYSISSELNI